MCACVRVCVRACHRLLNSSTEELNSDLWRVDGQAGQQKSAPSTEYTLAVSGASSREDGSDEDDPRQSHSPWASQIQSSARGCDLKRGDEVDVGLRVDTEVDDAEGELGSYRRSTPVFGMEDVGHSLGSGRSLSWTEDRVKGGSRDAVDSSSATADRMSDDRSPHVYGRGQGSGATSLQGAVGSEALESSARMRSGGGPAAAEGLGQGGGAFTPFRRDAATLQSSSPLQSNSSGPRSMACVGASTGSTTASDPWESNQSVTV